MSTSDLRPTYSILPQWEDACLARALYRVGDAGHLSLGFIPRIDGDLHPSNMQPPHDTEY